MESIYFVMTWLCHRTCDHCYDDRFRPYYGDDLRRVVESSKANFHLIINNFPQKITYFDRDRPAADGSLPERRGAVILAGGEILLEPVREAVLYPALALLGDRYGDQGGVKRIVQTTGDTLTPKILDELAAHGVCMISISGIDAYHKGLERPEEQRRLLDRLSRLLEAAGFIPAPPEGARADLALHPGPYFQFYGAQPDSWIGKLWPRGRAEQNELSTADITENFCNRWSGGLNFLDYHHSGSEVSVDPEGNVYPCCIKTRKPIGNLLREKLVDILDRLAGNPVYEAISMGHPERMGIVHGWSVDEFLAKSERILPSGRVYRNLCIGCDAFHEQVLMRGEALAAIPPPPCQTPRLSCEGLGRTPRDRGAVKKRRRSTDKGPGG